MPKRENARVEKDGYPTIHRIGAIAPNKHGKMIRILKELRAKIDELEGIRKNISRSPGTITPSQARAMIEEIKVPSLELIDAKPRKHNVSSI